MIFSATLLDVRLMEIHLCDMFQTSPDPTYDFLRRSSPRAGVDRRRPAVDPKGDSSTRIGSRPSSGPYYWEFTTTCSARWPPSAAPRDPAGLMIVIPRVGKDDDPAVRAEPVARLQAIAGRYGLPIFDLSDTFDDQTPPTLEIAAWDDHPNALGHHRLFLALAAHDRSTRTIRAVDPRTRCRGRSGRSLPRGPA